jgi:hypothetical protein
MAYVKDISGGHVRGGWIDEMAVLRDSEKSPYLEGLGAGASVQPVSQQPVVSAGAAQPNGVVLRNSLMFAHPEDKKKLADLQKQVSDLIALIGSGNAMFIPDEAIFRKIYTYGGTKVLDLIPPIFYKDGKFTKDTLANHSWCQTYAASVVGLGNDWVWPFYNQYVYRYPSSNPNYAGVPIDPYKNPGDWEDAKNAAIEADIQHALQSSSFAPLFAAIEQIMGSPAYSMFFKALGVDVTSNIFIMKATPELRSKLAAFGFDFANDSDMTKNMPPDQKAKLLATVNGDVEGKQLSGDALTTVRAIVGVGLVSNLIDMFTTSNTDPNKGVVNPCIREMNFDLVLGMLIAVVSAFLAVVSLGSAGLLGPTLQAIYWATYTAPSAIKGLVDLSK